MFVRRIVSFLILTVVIGIAIVVGGNKPKPRPAVYLSPTPTIALPEKIVIPVISVTAYVESVGLDSQKRMDIPKNPEDTAWYNLGPKPGEEGNAVIDGHVDLPSGAPSTFALLKNLQKGDSIIIIDKNNQKHQFVVSSSTSFITTSFPVQLVFGQTTGVHLNLITCSGQWDRNRRTYSERLVVFANKVD